MWIITVFVIFQQYNLTQSILRKHFSRHYFYAFCCCFCLFFVFCFFVPGKQHWNEFRYPIRCMQLCKIHCRYMKSFNETETPLIVVLCVWCFQEHLLYICLSFKCLLRRKLTWNIKLFSCFSWDWYFLDKLSMNCQTIFSKETICMTFQAKSKKLITNLLSGDSAQTALKVTCLVFYALISADLYRHTPNHVLIL